MISLYGRRRIHRITRPGARQKTRAVGEIQTESHFAQFLEWSLAAAPL
jgi:hypothetical protein